ncbi:alanine aminotransferase 2-like [Spea bombifrons]|uniref:alanine aminotransferase 2-like n=1 Tax=Spea bombifrons TaxID=233779 RepID=UPI002348F545|nr:alanine aminotransferase 2-like [Spea bombifrons]XP_053323520.1 alanine aminotransferase 2-like [Spea bombifrons]
MTSPRKLLTLESLSAAVTDIRVPLLGSLSVRAAEVQRELQEGAVKPFEELAACHLGDPHATGQRPCTFLRQVAALCSYPALLDSDVFPEDAKNKAKAIMRTLDGGSVGSYNPGYTSQTLPRKIARFIERRDGAPCDPRNVIVSGGATEAIVSVLALVVNEEEPLKTGIMVSAPRCPLYPDVIAMCGAVVVEYELDEERGWSLNADNIRRSLSAARRRCQPKVLCVINPGDPTGRVESREGIEEVIRLAAEVNLLLFADEVYQEDVFGAGAAFHSFKKVLCEMGPPYSEQIQLVSVNSISKGVFGECGLRGGYVEFVNIDPSVFEKLYVLKSFNLPNVLGSLALEVLVDPPQPGDPSYGTFIQERQTVLSNLAEKARLTEEILNRAPGIRCNPAQGAIYSFPRIEIPDKAMKLAEARGMEPDTFFCHQLLEDTGIVLAAGSSFGQAEGTHHIRVTLLPPVEKLTNILKKIVEFHGSFMRKYS